MNGSMCAQFDEQLEELAIGDLPEPERGRLLAHAASCRDCRGKLDEVLALTDSLLSLAPQHEPPPGFESRVLERLTAAPASGAAGAAGVAAARPPIRRHRLPVPRWWLEAAAAVLLVTVAIGAFLVGRSDTVSDAVRVVRSGVIVNGSGDRTGSVELIDAAHPYALVTIDHPRDRGGEVICELLLADGTDVAIGEWGYDDVRGKVWAAGIDDDLLEAVTMRILDESGTVLATASLD